MSRLKKLPPIFEIRVHAHALGYETFARCRHHLPQCHDRHDKHRSSTDTQTNAWLRAKALRRTVIIPLFTPGKNLHAKLRALHPTQIELIGATLAKPADDLHASLCALFPTRSEVILAAIPHPSGTKPPCCTFKSCLVL